MNAERRRWQEILFNRKMLTCIFLGFTSGLPFWVLISLVPAWLRTEGVDLADIGLFALATLPFNWKFLWSPLMDRYVPPFLGRRRGWAVITQIACLVGIATMGFMKPELSLQPIVLLVVFTAFFSASQDVVIDAYRRELLDADELGMGNSIHINAYRLATLVPGSLALILADHLPWDQVFLITSSFMLVGVVAMFLAPEVLDESQAPKSLYEAVIGPFREFFGRTGLRTAIGILAFMFLYKLGDNMAVALATPFYIDLGYSLTEIGSIAKVAALWASIAGTVLAGVVMLRVSINQALWLFGFVQMVTILGFAWLSTMDHTPIGLFLVVSGEYLGVGVGTVALTAFLMRESNRSFSATQFALFSSIASLPRTFAGAGTGFLVEGWGGWSGLGWTNFFYLCTVLAIPGMLLLLKVAPWNGARE